MTKRRHPFIVIEGLDGTGKATLRKNLYRLFEGVYDVTPLCLLTTNFLDLVAASQVVTGKYHPQPENAAAYLSAIRRDKAATVATLIRPALKQRPAIADRWLLSEMAFFAVKHPLITHSGAR
jgi:dTMP kinase